MCWRKIYRDIIKEDQGNTGQIACNKFMEILHNQDCFVSREELLKLFKRFGIDEDSESADQRDFEDIF